MLFLSMTNPKDLDSAKYRFSRDFVNYYLHSRTTKQPEYEIRIYADQSSIRQLQIILASENLEYRRIGLDIFPPPLSVVTNLETAIRILKILLPWYKAQKIDKKNVVIRIVKPQGLFSKVEDEHDIEKLTD